MPQFFFHLIDSVDVTFDPEGMNMPADAVPGAALLQARDCTAGDVKSGRLDLRYRIDAHDEAGELVHTHPFADAVEIIPAK